MTKAEASLIRKALEAEAVGRQIELTPGNSSAANKAFASGLLDQCDGGLVVTPDGREAYEETLRRA